MFVLHGRWESYFDLHYVERKKFPIWNQIYGLPFQAHTLWAGKGRPWVPSQIKQFLCFCMKEYYFKAGPLEAHGPGLQMAHGLPFEFPDQITVWKKKWRSTNWLPSLIHHSFCLHVGIKSYVRLSCLQLCTCSTATDCMKGNYTNLIMVKFQTGNVWRIFPSDAGSISSPGVCSRQVYDEKRIQGRQQQVKVGGEILWIFNKLIILIN